MLTVSFYDNVDDALLKFAVIISKSDGKWVLCKHKERDTYEVPGGHREQNETIFETTEREIQEETGAIDYGNKANLRLFRQRKDKGQRKRRRRNLRNAVFGRNTQ